MEIIDKYYKEAVAGLNDVILEDKDLWYSYVLHLPIHLQITYTLVILHQQIQNGGLHQYFFNSYGQFAYLTIDHLRQINADKTADILQVAVDKVNAEDYSINQFREKIFERELERIADFDEKLSDELEKLDDKYDSLDEDLEDLLMKYLRQQSNKMH